MGAREFHDGAQDGLEALEPLDPEQIGSFDGLLTAMRKTAFGGRSLGEAYEVLWAMIENPDCFVVLTLSGAMTIAKMDDRSWNGAMCRLDWCIDCPWAD